MINERYINILPEIAEMPPAIEYEQNEDEISIIEESFEQMIAILPEIILKGE